MQIQETYDCVHFDSSDSLVLTSITEKLTCKNVTLLGCEVKRIEGEGEAKIRHSRIGDIVFDGAVVCSDCEKLGRVEVKRLSVIDCQEVGDIKCGSLFACRSLVRNVKAEKIERVENVSMEGLQTKESVFTLKGCRVSTIKVNETSVADDSEMEWPESENRVVNMLREWGISTNHCCEVQIGRYAWYPSTKVLVLDESGEVMAYRQGAPKGGDGSVKKKFSFLPKMRLVFYGEIGNLVQYASDDIYDRRLKVRDCVFSADEFEEAMEIIWKEARAENLHVLRAPKVVLDESDVGKVGFKHHGYVLLQNYSMCREVWHGEIIPRDLTVFDRARDILQQSVSS